MTDAQAPMGAPGCIINWPMLKVHYRTDPEAIAALLPPGITVGSEPNVAWSDPSREQRGQHSGQSPDT